MCVCCLHSAATSSTCYLCGKLPTAANPVSVGVTADIRTCWRAGGGEAYERMYVPLSGYFVRKWLFKCAHCLVFVLPGVVSGTKALQDVLVRLSSHSLPVCLPLCNPTPVIMCQLSLLYGFQRARSFDKAGLDVLCLAGTRTSVALRVP
jgi:hypothetical protein